MVRFAFLAFVASVQPALGQYCGIQSSCSSCVSIVGCVWSFNACLSSSAVVSCGQDANCMNTIGQCPLMTSPVVYAQPLSTSLYAGVTSVVPPVYSSSTMGTVLPPVYSTAAAYPIYGASASIPYPIYGSYPVYGSMSAVLPSASIYSRPSGVPSMLSAPVYPPPLYSSASTSNMLPLASASLLPTYSSSYIPTYSLPTAGATLSSSVYTGTPMYSYPMYSYPMYSYPMSFAAPAYANTYVPPAYVSAGVSAQVPYYGPSYGNNNPNGPLFDVRGNPVANTIRNNYLVDALGPIAPGIGGYVSTANNLNVIRSAPRFVDNIVGGDGYNRDPFGAYIRNDLYTNQLSQLAPSIGGSLSAFNKLNFYANLLN